MFLTRRDVGRKAAAAWLGLWNAGAASVGLRQTFDFRSLERIPKLSAAFYQEVIARKRVV